MNDKKIILMFILMVSSSIAFAANLGQWVAVKDTLMRTSNGIMRVKVDYYQYDNPKKEEENFYQVEIDDMISLPPTEESYWPYSWNMGMKVLVEKFFEASIPVVKQRFPQICNWVENDKLQNSVIQVYFDDQQRILKKWIKTRTSKLSDIYAFVDELFKDNRLDDCLETIRVKFFGDNSLSVYPCEKLPDYLKKQIKDGKKGYYEMLPIHIEKGFLQKY